MSSPSSSRDLRGYESSVRRAVTAGNNEEALTEAVVGAAIARSAGNERAEWDFQVAACDALHALDRYRELQDLAQSMSRSDLARRDPTLRAESLVLIAIAQRCRGRIQQAVTSAGEALLLLEPTPVHASTRARAFQTLIAALVEAGRADQAWSHHADLADLLGVQVDEQTAGKGFWTLGNLAFMVGEHERGLEYHARASTLLSPANDIRIWSRFNKASADLQLMAGIAIEQTRDCIDRAMLTHEVMETTEMDRVGLAVTRARWGLQTQQWDEADSVLSDVTKNLEDPDAAYLVPAFQVWAQVLDAIRPADALAKRAEANRIEGLATASAG